MYKKKRTLQWRVLFSFRSTQNANRPIVGQPEVGSTGDLKTRDLDGVAVRVFENPEARAPRWIRVGEVALALEGIVIRLIEGGFVDPKV